MLYCLGRRVGRTCYSQTYPISYTKNWGRCIEVTLIDTITHAFKFFRNLNLVLKDTHIVERPWSKPIDTTNDKHVDDIARDVEHEVLHY
jgi:hypothetical protein